MKWLWIMLLCLVACSCGRPAEAPVAEGVRVATTSPAVGVMLRDMGAAHLAVGRSGYDIALDASLPVVGDAAGIDLERLAGVGATHVFVETGAGSAPSGLEAMGDRIGFELHTFELTDLSQMLDLAEAVHRVVSSEIDAGPPPGELFARALEHDGALSGAGRVLLLLPGTPAAALGPGSVHHEVLLSMGGVPAIASGRPYMPLDAEDLLAIAPDAIVLLSPGDSRPAVEVLGHASTLPLPAVVEGRVVVFGDADVLMASTSTLRYAQELRRVLRQWARGD